MQLSARDLDRCTEGLRGLYSHHDLGALRQAIVELLARLIAADLVAYNEFQLKTNRVTALLNTPSPRILALMPAFEAHLHQHPQISYYRRTKDGRARRISDFLSDRQLHELGLYHEFYRRAHDL